MRVTPQQALRLAARFSISSFELDVLGGDVDFHVKRVWNAAASRLDGVGFV
jgi:hypothetical protein